MPQSHLSRFISLLLGGAASPHTFNPWTDHDPTTDADPSAPTQRLARLRAHLNCNPRFILIGEAPGKGPADAYEIAALGHLKTLGKA
jgi:hypothetical protein